MKKIGTKVTFRCFVGIMPYNNNRRKTFVILIHIWMFKNRPNKINDNKIVLKSMK